MFFSILLLQISLVSSLNPFLKQWQCLGITSNIDFSRPFACNIGDLPLVVWKDNSGKLISTMNICKHMGSKLDTGKIVNGCLKCNYHGLEFSEKDKFGEVFEQDGKIFWAHNPIHKRPFRIPFFTNPNYVNNFLQIDMDCSLLDSAYNTMDIRHPEYVHNNLGFGSSLYPLNIKPYRFHDRVGLAFDYLSNDLMKFINNVNQTHNFHMYVSPSFTWSRVSFNDNHLIISVNFLPLERKKTRWFVTIGQNYNKSPNGQHFTKMLAKTIVSQDFTQLKHQYKENDLKRALLFGHIFKDEEAIVWLNELLKDYKYPDIRDCVDIIHNVTK
jgi:nitrite reductase/ring-hydroxylating ferredoxin subunit